MIIAFAIVRTGFGMAAAGRRSASSTPRCCSSAPRCTDRFRHHARLALVGCMVAGNRVYDAPAYAAGFVVFSVAAATGRRRRLGLARVEAQHKSVGER
jgi:hypothetical protein